MKIILSLIVIVSIASAVLFTQKSDQKEFCIEEWYAQTSALFQSAASLFPKGDTSSQQTLELDAKLQELLPSTNVDLTYRNATHALTEISSDSENGLLPNLFNKSSDVTTQVKGQVYTDDDDNIVGGQVNVSIPTDL